MPEEKPSVDQELAALNEACEKLMRSIADARSVREVAAFEEVEIPNHLRAVAYAKLPSLGRVRRLKDNRVEEIVQHQLHTLRVERNEIVASREFDRIKAGDWYVLRSDYPELYAKALREGNLILERKRQRK